MTRTPVSLALLLTFAILVPIHSTAHATQYSFTPLGLKPLAINSSGLIVGDTLVRTPNGAGGGSITNLPKVPNQATMYAASINTSGQVFGEVFETSGPYSALWTLVSGAYNQTVLPDINPLGSDVTYMGGVNDFGEVVGGGWDFYNNGGIRSFIWKPATANGTTGTMSSLGGGNGSSVSLNSINSSGDIPGSGPSGELLWKPSTLRGTSGTWFNVIPGTKPVGTRINDSGQIVGTTASKSL